VVTGAGVVVTGGTGVVVATVVVAGAGVVVAAAVVVADTGVVDRVGFLQKSQFPYRPGLSPHCGHAEEPTMAEHETQVASLIKVL